MPVIPNKININCIQTNSGYKVRCLGKTYSLSYPKTIWQSYPDKTALIDNLNHLLTINIPVVSKKVNSLQYNTSLPLFKPYFAEMVLNGIPHATEDYEESTQDALQRFLSAKYKFKDRKIKNPKNKYSTQEKAIISLSGGKDSLLTLALSNELGLNPEGVYVNDTVTPSENKAKITIMKKLAKEFKIKTHIVINEIERLVDYETWNEPETMLCYTHMMTGFCFIALPFAYHNKAKYIILGNEQDMDFKFTNKDGYLTCPSYDQSTEGMQKQNKMIKKMTSNSTQVTSLIKPLTNLNIIKILHSRYKEFGKHEFSCDCLNESKQKRWCCECNKCARHFIMLKAIGINPKTLKFPYNLLEKKYKKYYVIFKGPEIDCYEKSKEAFEEQIFAFYLAYKNKTRGYLIDLFRKKYLSEAKQREDEFYKKYLTPYPDPNMPKKLKKQVFSIYKEELP